MIPVRVKLHGFMPFRDGVELNFDTAKLWMLCGRNGAGKSTIFDAITFVLFGEGRFGGKDVQAYMNQDVVRGNLTQGAGRTMSVEFDFDMGHQRYRVRRICKMVGKEGKEQLGSDWSACKIDDQGAETPPIVGTDSRSGYFDWLNRTLGLNHEAFIASALLKQGESDKLISSSNRVRDDILRKIINLSDYEKLQAAVKAVTARWTSRQNSTETQMTALKGQITHTINATLLAFKLSEIEFGFAALSGPKDYWLSPDDLQKVTRLVDELQGIEAQANDEYNRIQERLAELKLIEARLADWRKYHRERADLLSKRAAYTTILKRAEEIERRFARCQELGKVLPLLEKWKKARKDWKDAEKQRRDATTEIDRLHTVLDGLLKQQPVLEMAQEKAQERHAKASESVGRETASHGALKKRRQEIEQSEGSPTCQVCGRELSEEQRQRLAEQVEQELEVAALRLANARKEEMAANTAFKAAQEIVKKHSQTINTTNLAQKDQENIRDKAVDKGRNAEEAAQQVMDALCSVEEECARLPVGSASYQPKDWRACILKGLGIPETLKSGNYPDEGDIRTVQQERAELKHAPTAKQELDEARQEAGKLDARIAVPVANIHGAAVDIRSKTTDLQDDGKPITDALSEAENAIQAEDQVIDDSLAARVAQRVVSPLQVTDECIRYSKEQQKAANARALGAHDAHIGLSEKHKGYLPLIPEWEESSQYGRLYTTLTAKLGREGVQSWLRKEAENRIVEYADLTLQRLSNGMLTVRLAENSEETLDLQVTDHEKNARGLKPGALSGSQKFRLSVALALGIGQYASGKSEGGIQSVIIDEGFGSLDKEGRDQMTAELENLGKILKRIIVVSHQEDMETAFENRWRIYVEDGTSKAELMA